MPENGSATRIRQPERVWARRAVKFVVSLATLVVLGGLAWTAAELLFESLPDNDAVLDRLSVVVGTVFGVTISLIKRIAAALGALSRWIVGSGWSGFLTNVVAFTVTLPLALFSVVLSATLLVCIVSEEPRPVDTTLREELKNAMTEHGYTMERARLLDNLAMLEPPITEALEDRFRFPILFERGQLERGGEGGLSFPEDLSDVRFSAGLKYAQVQDRDLIRELVRGLAPCGAEGGRPVRLRVEGYASSEPFEGAEAEVSRRLNLHLANERRRAVEGDLRVEIRRQGVGGAIELDEVRDYTETSEMERYRQFNDRPSDSPRRGNYQQDVFTRAAHVRVLDLAACSYEGG